MRGLATFLVLAAAPAYAQSASAQAEALFRDGRALMAQGKLADACLAFEGSQRLEPAITTLLNLGECREKNGQLASAWGAFVEAERQSRAGADPTTEKLHRLALDYARRLEPRVSTLTVHVSDTHRIDRLEILRDDKALDPGAWNRALPIDGGIHVIAARAPGATAWTKQLAVGVEGDAQTVEVPRLHAADLDVARPPASSSNLVPVTLGIAAVAMLGGAIGFDLWGDATYDRAKTEPDPTTQDSLWHSANDKRYAAQGLGVASLGCAGAAIWLLWRRPASETRASTAAHVTVVPTANGLSIAGWY